MDNRDIELFVNLSESESLLGDSMLMTKKIIKINIKKKATRFILKKNEGKLM